jgi:hypothetical protein
MDDKPDNQPSQWQFKPEETAQATASSQDTNAPVAQEPAEDEPHDAVSWEAIEFIDHDKPAGWYLMLFAGSALVCVAVYVIVKDIIAVATIALLAVIVSFAAARKPRKVQYTIDDAGVHIAERNYAFSQFKSFSVADVAGHDSIVLIPLKRLMPSISMFFDEEKADQIVDVLSEYLPFEEHKKDSMDQLIHRLRF